MSSITDRCLGPNGVPRALTGAESAAQLVEWVRLMYPKVNPWAWGFVATSRIARFLTGTRTQADIDDVMDAIGRADGVLTENRHAMPALPPAPREWAEKQKRPALIKAAKERYPGISGKAWFKANRGQLIDALVEPWVVPLVVRQQHDAWARGEKGGLARGAGEGKKRRRRTKEEVKAAVAEKFEIEWVVVDVQEGGEEVATAVAENGGKAQEKIDALSALVTLLHKEPEIDEQKVKRIVDGRFDELAKLLRAPVVVEVRKEGVPTIVVEGQHKLFSKLLDAVALRDAVILTGPPGTGKSFAARKASEILGLHYFETSVGPTMTESRLLGYQDAAGRYVKTQFRIAYESGGLFLLDEADNGSGAVIAVLNNAFANGRCSFPDKVVEQHPDFCLVVAANTVGHGATREYLGRQTFDGPFRDRLTFIDWPIDEALEDSIAAELGKSYGLGEGVVKSWVEVVRKMRAAIDKSGQVRVLASPRATIKGIKYLSRSWTIEQVKEAVIWKGASPEVRKKIGAVL